MAKRINFDQVDWTLRDIDLAERLGVTKTTVGRARKRLGKPQSPSYRKHSGILALMDHLRSLGSTTSEMTVKEIQQSCPAKVSTRYIYIILRQMNLRYAKHYILSAKAPINWDLPNVDINTIWDRSADFAANKRWQRKIRLSLWKKTEKRTIHDFVYLKMIKEEKQKAKKWREENED